MRTRVTRIRAEHAETIPEVRPWREAGWIFRDGDTLAIERKGKGTRVRTPPVRRQRED